jgi:murein DD-endopeptidase / murein LD-carboxypeptidase
MAGTNWNTRPSSHRAMLTPASELAIRVALARRAAWIGSRQRLQEPAQVQDPPATQEVAHAVAVEGTAEVDQPGRASEEVMMASADQTANNEDLIREALRARGTPYVWGGASRGGFDCSGFVLYLFRRQRGIKLPHSASAQSRMGRRVSKEELQPGDLVFFSTYRRGISHVGMYIGENRFIHAASRRSDVRVDSLSGYWGRKLKSARRISPAPIRFTPQDLQDYMQQEPSETPPGPAG